LSEQSGQDGNSGDQLFLLQSCEPRFGFTLQSLNIGVWRHCVTWSDSSEKPTMTRHMGRRSLNSELDEMSNFAQTSPRARA
jgi:hypothetical protein